MKRLVLVGMLGAGLTAWSVQATPLSAQETSVHSLRGDVPIVETAPAEMVKSQNTQSGRFSRAYRQQPPMIPHRIDKYEIDLKVNQCMRCHDWPNNVEEGAPKISETHYTDRNGVALDHVSRNRWFCIQCHVPQVNANTLVGNSFKRATDVK